MLENIPEGKKAKTSECDQVFTALTNLRFDDVMRQSSDLTFDGQYICRLNNTTVYTIKTARKDDKAYVTCGAEYTGEIPQKDRRVESEEELKVKEAKLLALDKVQRFTAKHQGWVYEIAEWKAKNLTKRLSDLVEDEPKPEEAKPNDPNSVKE